MVIVVGMIPNTRDYPYGANRRYTWQRWTGVIAFVFIVYHVFHMHGWFHFDPWLENVVGPYGGAQFKPYNAASTAGKALQSGGMLVFYAVGVLACVFHFANGLWTMGITWGVWTSPPPSAARSRLHAFGVLLAAGRASAPSTACTESGHGTGLEKAIEIEDRMYKAESNPAKSNPTKHKRAVHNRGSDRTYGSRKRQEQVAKKRTVALPCGIMSRSAFPAWLCSRISRQGNDCGVAKQRVLVVGGGLAGLAASMKLAELGVAVDLMSLTPVKRSHSVCAQGGINSVNDLTRQQGDSEWMHFDDTVYGGDFLQHQPPVKEMVDWAPRIIDLMDRLGVPFNRTPEGFRDQRRFGGTLFKRTAFAGATTGQQLLYALDEQVRRWHVGGHGHEVRGLGLPGPDPRRHGPLPRLRRPRTWSRWRFAPSRPTP